MKAKLEPDFYQPYGRKMPEDNVVGELDSMLNTLPNRGAFLPEDFGPEAYEVKLPLQFTSAYAFMLMWLVAARVLWNPHFEY